MGKHNGKRYYFLYRTTNLVNFKYYYGVHSTYNLEDGYLGSGKRLKRAIKKYGVEKFKCEILEFFENRKDVLRRENEVVNEICLQDPLCMNLQLGGGGGIHNEEHKIKFQKAGSIKGNKKLIELRKDINWKLECGNSISKGLKNSKKFQKSYESRRNNPNWCPFKNKKHSEATKKRMSEKAKLRPKEKHSQFGTCWIYNSITKENKKIKKIDLNYWINLNWIKGRQGLG